MGREDKILTILDVHRGCRESRNAPGWNQSVRVRGSRNSRASVILFDFTGELN